MLNKKKFFDFPEISVFRIDSNLLTGHCVLSVSVIEEANENEPNEEL